MLQRHTSRLPDLAAMLRLCANTTHFPLFCRCQSFFARTDTEEQHKNIQKS